MELSIFAPILCGFLVGLCIFFTGVGGGALIIPVIVFFFSQPPSVAVGTAGVYAVATKILAAADNARTGNIDYRLFARIVVFSAPGVLLAAAAVNVYLAVRPQERDLVQEVLRGAVVGAILCSLLAAHLHIKGKRAFAGSAFGVGAMMGMTGVGGGVLLAPLMLAFSAAPPKKIVGTSILAALVLSLLGALIYAGNKQVNYELALWMSVGSLLASIPGGRLLRRASEKTVRRAMLALVFLAALLMLADGAGLAAWRGRDG